SKTAKIPLPIDERIAQREVLRHAHQRRIDDTLTMGMVVTADVTGDLRALAVGPCRREVQITHGHENAAMHGFQTVPHIRQGTADDDRHGVVHEGRTQFIADVDWDRMFLLDSHCHLKVSRFTKCLKQRLLYGFWYFKEYKIVSRVEVVFTTLVN